MKAAAYALALSSFFLSFPSLSDSLPHHTVIQHHAQKINLNTADIKTLIGSFQRIGKIRAEAIVNYRQQHGGFKSVAELAQIRGLGQTFVSRHLKQLQETFVVE